MKWTSNPPEHRSSVFSITSPRAVEVATNAAARSPETDRGERTGSANVLHPGARRDRSEGDGGALCAPWYLDSGESCDSADVPRSVFRNILLYGIQAQTAKSLRDSSPNQRMRKLGGPRVTINRLAAFGAKR